MGLGGDLSLAWRGKFCIELVIFFPFMLSFSSDSFHGINPITFSPFFSPARSTSKGRKKTALSPRLLIFHGGFSSFSLWKPVDWRERHKTL
jgi:hypothetical protein